MNISIRTLCKEVYPEVVTLRRKLHENAELGRREFATTKLISDFLSENGIENSSPLETGPVTYIIDTV